MITSQNPTSYCSDLRKSSDKPPSSSADTCSLLASHTWFLNAERIGGRKLSRNASAVSDAPHNRWAGRFGKSYGARPIQLFEGSRPWVRWTLRNLNRFWPDYRSYCLAVGISDAGGVTMGAIVISVSDGICGSGPCAGGRFFRSNHTPSDCLYGYF